MNLQMMTTTSTRAAKQSAVRKNASQMIEYIRHYHESDLHKDYTDHIRTYDWFERTTIDINSIPSDGVDLDTDKVNSYSDLDDREVPSIVIADGVILDGYHRVTVAKTKGKTHISAYVGVTA